MQLVEHLAPGQALVQQLHSWGLNSLCSNLVGDSEPKDFSAKTTQNVYRDFPREGEAVFFSSCFHNYNKTIMINDCYQLCLFLLLLFLISS